MVRKKKRKKVKREIRMIDYSLTIEQLKRRKVAEALAKRAAEKRAKEQWAKLKKEEKERIEKELEKEKKKREKREKWGIIPKKYERHVAVTKRVGETIARGLRGYAREFEKATNGEGR